MKKEVAKVLIRNDILGLKPKLKKLSSGIKSPIYCGLKDAQYDVNLRNYLLECLMERIANYERPEVIAGVVSGIIPFSSIIAARMNIPHVSVRMPTKKVLPLDKVFGEESLLDGKLEEGKKVLLLDDVVVTGKSSINAIKEIRKAGGELERCLTIVNYNTKASKDAFKEIGCELDYLTDIETMLVIYILSEQPAKTVLGKLERFAKKYFPQGSNLIEIIKDKITSF